MFQFLGELKKEESPREDGTSALQSLEVAILDQDNICFLYERDLNQSDQDAL